MPLSYVTSTSGVSAISMPADEAGLLVKSVDWSTSTNKKEYNSAALQGAVVGVQHRNPVMAIGIDAWLLSTTSGVPGYAPGATIASLTNYTTATVGSYMMGFSYTGGKIVWENPSVTANGEENPSLRGTAMVYPFAT